MGWSCTAKADEVLQAWSLGCYASTNTNNVWTARGKRYFYEVGRENRDGSITGIILENISGNACRKVGTFRIEPDGKVFRGPKMLKDMAKFVQKREEHRIANGLGRNGLPLFDIIE